MDLFTGMRVFVQIVERGSLSAAASVCNISPTMVGNHLQTLEQRLGTTLLNRTTRRQQLTDSGQQYYQRCVEILQQVADADAQAREGQAVPRGRLRVSAPVSFGSEALVPLLDHYLERYPEVTLDLVLSDRQVDLIEEAFEAAIRIGPLPDSGLIARPLQPYRMLICASPDYLARRGMPRHPRELATHSCLALNASTHTRWRMNGPDGPISVPVGSRLQLNNGQALRTAALNGLGVVMQPEVLMAQDLAAGRLVQLFPDHELPSRPMHLVYLPDRYRMPKLRSFIEFTLERFGPDTTSK
ncbi:LysR family transcriptional regulator [Marinobacterium sp. D7]|uniref:LysR family transcriptional regulator n=1 Tax=Marinobacterium ramblicola TaxID=2849041 RepID=UPI001C2D3FE4|nr:LysR family transcriptional regulator [Marinobacterium ramblicola]MBV1786989.1 LysR family transcriptional regulator [Marinobacterium ramblicola]